jgi:DNA polymerase-3 subunit delta'
MRLTDVQHQERAVSILRRALRSGRTHHAYLFDGPDGVGKELTARALAARLLCLDRQLAPEDDACGACASCRLLAADNHPDFHLVHRGLHQLHPDRVIRASKGLFLVVDVVRHFLIEPAGMKPTQSPRRVFLIRDAERMNEEAQNALLKTLEEPPGAACLILLTSSAARLLPTIRSRCQQVPFGLLPPAFVAQRLAEMAGASAEDAGALAQLAGGRLGVAALWQRAGVLDAVDTAGACVDALPAGNPEAFGKGLVELATELAGRVRAEEAADNEDGGETKSTGGKSVGTDALRAGLKLVFLLVATLYRDALVVATGAPALRHLPGQTGRVDRLAHGTPLERLESGIHAISEAERNLDRNVAPQLVCERLAVGLLGELSTV